MDASVICSQILLRSAGSLAGSSDCSWAYSSNSCSSLARSS